jgi:hypothetical protein
MLSPTPLREQNNLPQKRAHSRDKVGLAHFDWKVRYDSGGVCASTPFWKRTTVSTIENVSASRSPTSSPGNTT